MVGKWRYAQACTAGVVGRVVFDLMMVCFLGIRASAPGGTGTVEADLSGTGARSDVGRRRVCWSRGRVVSRDGGTGERWRRRMRPSAQRRHRGSLGGDLGSQRSSVEGSGRSSTRLGLSWSVTNRHIQDARR